MRNNTSNPNAKNNSNVAHNWAHLLTNVIKGSNFYYVPESGILYSYGEHAPIGRNIANNTYFVTLTTWGNATSKHLSYMRSAIPTGAKIIAMKNVITCNYNDNNAAQYLTGSQYSYRNSKYTINEVHQKNLKYWLEQLQFEKTLFLKARNKSIRITSMEKFGEDINNYCSFFGLSRLDFIPAYTEFEAWFNSLDTAAIRTTEQEQNKLIEAKKQAKNERLLTEAIPMWRNFEVRELPHNIVSKYTLLRCNKSTQCVETSKGIKVPYSLALSLYSNIQAAIDKGGCNDCNVSVMQYQINTINKEYIIAGCHIITIEEIQACYTNIQATINA